MRSCIRLHEPSCCQGWCPCHQLEQHKRVSANVLRLQTGTSGRNWLLLASVPTAGFWKEILRESNLWMKHRTVLVGGDLSDHQDQLLSKHHRCMSLSTTLLHLPGTVTLPFPWAACSSASQPFRKEISPNIQSNILPWHSLSPFSLGMGQKEVSTTSLPS